MTEVQNWSPEFPDVYNRLLKQNGTLRSNKVLPPLFAAGLNGTSDVCSMLRCESHLGISSVLLRLSMPETFWR